MYIHIVTIFPNFFNEFLSTSFVKKAIERKLFSVNVYNLRDFGVGKHKKVDDEPFGGGGGMLMMIEPLVSSIEYIKSRVLLERKNSKIKVVLLTPQGKVYNQNLAIDYVNNFNDIILLCGRYEGFDERITEFVDDEISIGDFVLSGGEVPSMVIVESMIRILPGVIGSADSYKQESFYSDMILDYPQYTKPRIFRNYEVPDVLLSGNHKAIEDWRQKNKILNTKKKRSDLLNK